MTPAAVADDLTRVVTGAVAELRTLADAVADLKPRPDAWSIKEIIGHLVDSAANNHQRFVRGQQVRELVLPGYEQDAWIAAQDYQAREWPELLEFWAAYNRHLAHVIRRLPAASLDVVCRIGGNEPATLGFIVEDYVTHMRHHLSQIAELR